MVQDSSVIFEDVMHKPIITALSRRHWSFPHRIPNSEIRTFLSQPAPDPSTNDDEYIGIGCWF